ncbi:S8 family serine peptidase [Sporomusa acidovorans]|uniref:S8 family serine peptidase n=1 Tax=Sporomusa acidovorans TaxID=112900 RepID=UPI002481D08D|nr:S8 family serine peptidase [Sporomusa acidovorans]
MLKVLGGDGGGSLQGITEAIHYAIDWKGAQGEKVRIISMSLGGPQGSEQLHDAIIRAANSGILVVCAAGNTGIQEEQFPGHWC